MVGVLQAGLPQVAGLNGKLRFMLSPLLSGPANVWPAKVKLPQGWIFSHDANRRQKRKPAAIKPGGLRTLARADGRAFMGREITETTLSGRSAFGQRKKSPGQIQNIKRERQPESRPYASDGRT